MGKNKNHLKDINQSQASHNNPILLTILTYTGSLLLLPPALAITHCIAQSRTTEKCILCHKSTTTVFGSCTPLHQSIGCALSNSTNKKRCVRCEPKYFLEKDTSRCRPYVQSPPPIKNCHSSYSKSSYDTHPYCTECKNGFPNWQLSECLSFSEANPEDKPFLKNCRIGNRATTASNPRCFVCDQGYSFDTKTGKCTQLKVKGCWQSHNGVCNTCQAWDGLYSDGFNNTKTLRHALCRERYEQEWDIVYQPQGKVVKADLTRKDIAKIFPEESFKYSSITNYGDIKGCFVTTNWTHSFLIKCSNNSSFKILDFGFDDKRQEAPSILQGVPQVHQGREDPGAHEMLLFPPHVRHS